MIFLSSIFQYAVLGILIWGFYGVVWRLYLSPVAKFPGSRLAALTFWYEFYFDFFRSGSYVYEIERMHKVYGPIIRINPYELHVMSEDLHWINQLYPTVGCEVDKFWWSAGMFGSTDMTFGTVPHLLHRTRRAAFGRFFSPAMIRKLEPMLQGLVNSLCSRIEAEVKAGKTVNLVHAFSALTQDVITEYCFAQCRGVLEMEDFAPHYYKWMQVHCTLTPLVKFLPWLIPTLDYLPDWWIRATNAPAWDVRMQTTGYVEQTRRVLAGGDQDQTEHATIFHALRDDPDLPPWEKSQSRLAAEAASLVGAGTLTSAHMLSLTTFMVLDNATILQKLMTELKTAIPDREVNARLSTVEQLPYLNAVINEGLRLSHGTMHRLARVHPRNALKFQDHWTIPPDTPVAMTPYFWHMHPSIFPDPYNFDPERWLIIPDEDQKEDQNEKKQKEKIDRMHKYLGNFGRGSRQCAGMRLAYAEIYLTLAHLFRRLGNDMGLFDTERERDVDFVHDFFIPAPHFHSRGVRVCST